MPIQFPRPTGPYRSIIESQWLKLKTKAFDAVPAPNFTRPGVVFADVPHGAESYSFDPGVAVQRAVNLRRPNTMYSADGASRVNPAPLLTNVYDSINSNDRVMGQQSERIIGVSRDAAGAPLSACVVKVFCTLDDTVAGSTVSDGSGNWTVYPNQPGPYYFVEYKAGPPDVFGTSPNTNTSTQFRPGQ